MASKASRRSATSKTAKKAATSKVAKTKATSKTAKAKTTKTKGTDARKPTVSKAKTKTTKTRHSTHKKAVPKTERKPGRPKVVVVVVESDFPAATRAALDVEDLILSVLPGPTEEPISRHTVRDRVNATPPGFHFEQLAINDGLFSLVAQRKAEQSSDGRFRRTRAA